MRKEDDEDPIDDIFDGNDDDTVDDDDFVTEMIDYEAGEDKDGDEDDYEVEKEAAMNVEALNGFVGQSHIIERLKAELYAADLEGRSVRHMILYGAPGTGKDHLVRLLAEAMGVGHRIVSLYGSNIKLGGNKWDWRHMFLQLEPEEVPPDIADRGGGPSGKPAIQRLCFINEAECVPRHHWQTIHAALQPNADGLRIYTSVISRRHHIIDEVWAPPFTMVCCTNYLAEFLAISEAAVSRFPLRFEFTLYHQDDLCKIVTDHSNRREIGIQPDAAMSLAQRCKGTPRRLLQQLWVAANNERVTSRDKEITIDHVKIAMEREQIEPDGLTQQDLRYLQILAEQGDGAGVGLQRLAFLLGLPAEYILQEIEPWMAARGLIVVDNTGRVLTVAGLNRAHASGLTKMRLVRSPPPQPRSRRPDAP